MHALVEVLKLDQALLLGAGRPDAVGTLDPLLLEGVAARRHLKRLLSALQQQPVVQVEAKPFLQVYNRHDANAEEWEETEDEKMTGGTGQVRGNVDKGEAETFASALEMLEWKKNTIY